mgnify:CR=1 FL=1
MANIPIWPGSSSFALVSNPTPFAFYDTDTSFIAYWDLLANTEVWQLQTKKWENM